jgi:hypothetical protein
MTNFISILSASQSFIDISKPYIQLGCTISIVDCINVSLRKNDLCFEVLVSWSDISGNNGTATHEVIIKVGHKTPSGYLSTKKLGIAIENLDSLTEAEITQVLALQTDAIAQKFDPFFAQNNSQRKNASAWVSVALNHLQEDCRN